MKKNNNDMDLSNVGLNPILPQDLEAEKNVLGTIINNDGMFSIIEDVIDSNAFRDKTLQAIFRCIKYLHINNKYIDTSAIIDTSKRFSKDLGINLERYDVIDVLSYDNKSIFKQNVDRIVEYGKRRKAWEILIKASEKVISLSDDVDETLTDIIHLIDDIMGIGNTENNILDANAALKIVMEQIQDNIAGINKASIKTGFRFSDTKGGFRLGSLVVIGAFTSVGKSTLAMNMTVNIAKSGIPTAYYSLEMSAAELWSRVLNEYTGIEAWKIQGYALKKDELNTIDKKINELSNLPIYIDDKATTSFDKMIRSVRKMVKKYKIKMFVVDYLQIFAQNMKGIREETAISSMARECKNICRELNIVCILLSQLHRAGEVKHPTFDMLRGSGQIEESADNVVLIDRPEAHPDWGVSRFQFSNEDIHGKAEIRVVKGRNIGTGIYYVGFDHKRFVFYELDGYNINNEINSDEKIEDKDPFPMKQISDRDLPF